MATDTDGWMPGDKYDPMHPLIPIRTVNARLRLMNRGLWSSELVARICKMRPFHARRTSPKPHRSR